MIETPHMSLDVIRRDELRPGIPQIREVGDVEGEVNRLSRSGWIAVLWPRVPPPSEALDLLLLAVGKVAKECSYRHPPRWTPDAWSRAAKALLDDSQLPIPVNFGHELTLHRLIRWIEPEARALVMGVSDFNRDLRTVEIVGEWFSRAAEAGCLVLTPSAEMPSRRETPPPPPPAEVFRSEAERVLFGVLNRDESLRDLFEPNVRVVTRFQTTPCVDFLWREGKIIIEIDSYFTHGGQIEFASDRQRDYETLVSGYLTVRLLYEEVMRDSALALNKVRRVVTLRRDREL